MRLNLPVDGRSKEEEEEEEKVEEQRRRVEQEDDDDGGMYSGPFVSGKWLNCKQNVTFEPWILKTCKVLADSEAVTSAVNIEMMITPVIIHRMQNTRPRADLGERSPYL